MDFAKRLFTCILGLFLLCSCSHHRTESGPDAGRATEGPVRPPPQLNGTVIPGLPSFTSKEVEKIWQWLWTQDIGITPAENAVLLGYGLRELEILHEAAGDRQLAEIYRIYFDESGNLKRKKSN